MPHVLAVIVARAGSKGLPNKCVAPLAGRAVIEYTFDAAQAARRVDAVCLTTDAPAAQQLARARHIAVVERPPDLATDTATVDAAVRHAVEQFETRPDGFRPDIVVLLYGNVPLRPDGAIDRAIDHLLAARADSVRTVAPVTKQHPDWIHRLSADRMVKFRENSIYRRQELEPLFYHDGAVVVLTRAALFTTPAHAADFHAFFGRERSAIVVEAGATVDIDDPRDLALAEALLSAQLAGPPSFPLIVPGQPYVIAEAGVNHDGALDQARRLIDAARAAGADAVKFQAFSADELVSRSAAACDYQRRRDPAATTQHAMLRRLELPADALAALRNHARGAGIEFLCTPFGVRQVRELAALGVRALKLASPDLVNVPLVQAAAETGLPLICSTGAADDAEIDTAVARLRRLTAPGRFALLHCVSSYPTPQTAAHLAAIGRLKRRHRVCVGYSDHTAETDTGALAVAAGAQIVEKHLTLDRAAPGPDHAFSLEPAALRDYVARLRGAAAALGSDGPVELSAEQRETRAAARCSVVAARAIRSGEPFTPENLTVRRPAGGLEPAALAALFGRTAARDVAAGDRITWASVSS